MSESSSDKPCRLLNLPPELRNRIWELVVIVKEPLVIMQHFTTLGLSCRNLEYLQRPGLLSTCRMVRQETLRMFYAANTFTMEVGGPVKISSDDGFRTLTRWLNSMGPDVARCLQSVHFYLKLFGTVQAQTLLPWVTLFGTASQTLPESSTIKLHITEEVDRNMEETDIPDLINEFEKLGRKLRHQGFDISNLGNFCAEMLRHLEEVAGGRWSNVLREIRGAIEYLHDEESVRCGSRYRGMVVDA